MNKIVKQNWYTDLVEDCQAIITETGFSSQWILIEGYKSLGDRILEDADKEPITKLVKRVSVDLSKSERIIWKSVQFAKKYPDLSKLPEGKKITLRYIFNELLPEPKRLEDPSPPKGKFEAIYCDIPWAYDVDLSNGATRSPENNYPVMNLEEIKRFEVVKQAAADNCVLFMWITAPKLNWMNEVLEAWGFEYKTNLIWDKIKPNMGHYSSVRHEILIIAGKGKAAPTCDGKTIQSIDSVQSIEKSSRHSEKPNHFREIIETLYPNKKYLEVFARGNLKRKNWIFWGNEYVGN